MHRMVARDTRAGRTSPRTLEIGAGNLNHLQYEPQNANYDVIEELVELTARSPRRNLIRRAYGSIDEIRDQQYERIISIAVFEHYCDLPKTVAKCGLLLAPDGHMRIGIPSEGTLLWRIGWELTTGMEFRIRHRLNYGLLMRHEHVNTAQEISAVLRYFFRDAQCKVLGLTPALSFYQFFDCSSPDLSRCHQILEGSTAATS